MAVVAAVSIATGHWWGLIPLVLFGLITCGAALRRGGTKRSDEAKMRAAEAVTPSMTATADLAKRLTEHERSDTRELLKIATETVAQKLSVSPTHVRANLFGRLRNGRLGILPGLCYNMDKEPELALEIDLGRGSTGLCFSCVEPHLATFDDGWAADALNDEGMTKIHPDLRWIASIPVTTGKPPQAVWVLNVDGIVEAQSKEQLRDVPLDLVNYGQALAVLVADLASRPQAGRGGEDA
jgi:hypothetical protein